MSSPTSSIDNDAPRFFKDAERARSCALGINRRHRIDVVVHVMDRTRPDATWVLIGMAVRQGNDRSFKLAGLDALPAQRR